MYASFSFDADFNAVLGTQLLILQFAAQLSASIANYLAVLQSSFIITSVSSGSIVVELTLLQSTLVNSLASLINNGYTLPFNGNSLAANSGSFQTFSSTTPAPTISSTSPVTQFSTTSSLNPTQPSKSSGSNQLVIIVAVVVGGVVLLAVIVFASIAVWRRGKRSKASMVTSPTPNRSIIFTNPTYDNTDGNGYSDPSEGYNASLNASINMRFDEQHHVDSDFMESEEYA